MKDNTIITLSHPGSRKFYDQQEASLTCQVCAHRCQLKPGQMGVCGVRINVEGQMRLLTYGRVAAAALDPIEKKPLRHFRPGSKVYTIATPGCTLACKFCQNWELALMVRKLKLTEISYQTPEQVIQTALDHGADGMGFSYTEPVVSLEFTLDVMKKGRERGLFNVWHTNGFMTSRSVSVAQPLLDAVCIDLKAADEFNHRRVTGGKLAPVVSTAIALKNAGVWVEISTPVLCGVNDSPADLAQMARIIHDQLGADTPWHLLRGHASWKLNTLPLTSVGTLQLAARIGKEAGLAHVYLYP